LAHEYAVVVQNKLVTTQHIRMILELSLEACSQKLHATT